MAGGSVDALNVKISADISRLQSGLKRCMSQLTGLQTTTTKTANKMQSSFSKVGDSIKKVAGIIGAAFAVNEIKKFGKAAIDAASDLAEVQNVVDTVFGSMSDNINAWSQSAMTAFGLSETSAKQFTSTMGAMLKSSGITGKALETMSINMAALSADMASFYNLDSQTAFQKIRAGISGETEPLKQLGINMSVANLEAYALSKGITKSYQAMSQSEQMILRYNYLLTVTADAQHDFERTSSGWANQTRILSENFNRLKTIIGTGLIQALTPLLNMLNTLIAKVVEFAQAVAKAFGAGGDDGGMSGLSDDAAGTAEGLEDADKAAKKLNNTLGGIDELNIVGDNADTSSITDQLGNLKPISVYDTVGKGLDGISEKMTAFVDKLKEKLEPVAQLAKDIKQSFIDAFKGDLGDSLLTNLKTGFWTLVGIVGAFAEAFDKAWTNNDKGTNFLKTIEKTLVTITGLANDVGKSLENALKSPAGIEWMDSVITKWESFWLMIDGIGEGLRNAWNDNGAGTTYIESIFTAWTKINDAIATVRTTIGEVFSGDAGTQFFGNLIGLATEFNNLIASISQSFTDAWNENDRGKRTLEDIVGIASGILDIAKMLVERFTEAWNENDRGKEVIGSIMDFFEKILEHVKKIIEIWKEQWDNDTTTEIFGNILDTVKAIVDGVGEFIDNIMTAAEQSGLLQGTVQLIQDIIKTLVERAKATAENFKEMASKIDWKPLMEALSHFVAALQKIWDVIQKLLDGPLGEIAKFFMAAFGAAIQAAIWAVSAIIENIATMLDRIGKLANALVEIFRPVFRKLKEIIQPVKDIFGDIVKVIGNVMTGVTNVIRTITGVGDVIGDFFGGVASTFGFDVDFAASGGVFGPGELFVANERGPELIGNYGNNTAVMNNTQIVDAVSSGVASAMSPLIDMLSGGYFNQPQPQAVIRGSDLMVVMQRAELEHGARISTNFGNFGVG